MTDETPAAEAAAAAPADNAAQGTVDAAPRGRHRPPVKRSSRGSFARELPFLILIAFVLALLIKAFLVQAFFIPSGSMQQTLEIKDRVLVNKLVYRFRDVHRGEIVVFNGKNTNFPQESVLAPATNPVQKALRKVSQSLGLGAPGEKDFIKRVIALPGDTVSCCQDGKVVVNGKALDEPYLFEDDHKLFCAPLDNGTTPASDAACRSSSKPFTVPAGSIFVMGDHRSLSSDSRVNGPIPESAVIGRAFIRVWPFSRFGRLPVPETFHDAGLGALGLALPVTAARARRRRAAGRHRR